MKRRCAWKDSARATYDSHSRGSPHSHSPPADNPPFCLGRAARQPSEKRNRNTKGWAGGIKQQPNYMHQSSRWQQTKTTLSEPPPEMFHTQAKITMFA
eukprot:1053615-Pleurochrysis_carterae.AAC.1